MVGRENRTEVGEKLSSIWNSNIHLLQLCEYFYWHRRAAERQERERGKDAKAEFVDKPKRTMTKGKNSKSESKPAKPSSTMTDPMKDLMKLQSFSPFLNLFLSLSSTLEHKRSYNSLPFWVAVLRFLWRIRISERLRFSARIKSRWTTREASLSKIIGWQKVCTVSEETRNRSKQSAQVDRSGPEKYKQAWRNHWDEKTLLKLLFLSVYLDWS